MRERGRWVHPSTHTISKLMPNNPPRRGDRVLVDGERCRVLRCPVKWDGRDWEMTRGVKVVSDCDTTRNEESEPVLIETVGDAVVFALDDGERLEFDRVELLSALGSAIAGDMGRLRAA